MERGLKCLISKVINKKIFKEGECEGGNLWSPHSTPIWLQCPLTFTLFHQLSIPYKTSFTWLYTSHFKDQKHIFLIPCKTFTFIIKTINQIYHPGLCIVKEGKRRVSSSFSFIHYSWRGLHRYPSYLGSQNETYTRPSKNHKRIQEKRY